MDAFFMHSAFSGGFFGIPLAFFLSLALWSVAWKGYALWKAARNQHQYWFIALLLINTVGILEIIYLLTVGKKAGEKMSKELSKEV